MKKLKLGLLAFIGALFGAVANAQELTAAETAMNSIATEMTGLIATALPIVASVSVAGLGLYMIPRAVRWIRSAGGR